MPVKRERAKPPHSHPELVEALANELVANSPKPTRDIPDIREEEQTYGGRLHVTVLWEKWAGVPQSERGPIILDAYRTAKGELEMLKITLAQGFTIEEHRRWLSRRAQEGHDD